jgi:NADH dehydrogenase
MDVRERKVHVLVLGAGFGGMTFCETFRHPRARVTLIDRQNHHLFQPLLYQVATAGLAAPDIAQPIRSILRSCKHVTVVQDEVTGFDLAERVVRCAHTTHTYDYLVLSLGGVTSYFGHPEWEEFAPGLKSLADAQKIRTQTLYAFERAEREIDPEERARLMTMVVIGGGPTGVEMAGALAELRRFVLVKDFRRIDPAQTRVILVEGSDTVLSHMGRDVGESARRQLESLGVEVRTSCRVLEISAGRVKLNDGSEIRAETIVWAAGVGGNPIAARLEAETDRAGRVKVLPDLSLPGHPHIFSIGDMAYLVDATAQPVPGVSPAAIQMAQHVSRIIAHELGHKDFKRSERPAFAYFDKGTMATIGRSRAVAVIGNMRFSGMLAWLLWLVVHLIFLIDLRNKLIVFFSWVIQYFTYERGARVFALDPRAGPGSGRPST